MAGLWLFEPCKSDYVLPAYLALVCVPLYALTGVQDGIGKGFAWMGVALLPPYILRPALLLGSMVAAHYLGFAMQARTAAAAAIVATWATGILQAAAHRSPLAADREAGPAPLRLLDVVHRGDAAARHRRQRARLPERGRAHRLPLS